MLGTQPGDAVKFLGGTELGDDLELTITIAKPVLVPTVASDQPTVLSRWPRFTPPKSIRTKKGQTAPKTLPDRLVVVGRFFIV